jgi:hypothetical protein
MTMPLSTKGKIDTELEYVQGRNIVEACLENNIQHLVLSTVLYVEEGQENTFTYIKSALTQKNPARPMVIRAWQKVKACEPKHYINLLQKGDPHPIKLLNLCPIQWLANKDHG